MSERELHRVTCQRIGETAVPLTFQQRFYLQIHLPGKTSNISDTFALLLSGELSIEFLRRSFEEVIRRHEALRTRVVTVDGVQMQHIDECSECCMPTVDLKDGPEGDAKVRARTFIEDLANTRCDLEIGPLFDVRLLKLAENEHVLIFRIHHVISDGCSFQLMFEELWLLYGEFIRGRPCPLKPVRFGYVEYAIWQQRMQRAWPEKHASYWTGRLAGATGVRWPVKGHENQTKRGTVALRELALGEELSVRLREFARRARSLLSMVMLAMYVAVLGRWCDQRDFIVATTTAGRDRAEHNSAFGYFAHLLYLRMQLAGDETYMDLIGQVTQEFYRSLMHKDFGGVVAQTSELLAGTLFQWVPWSEDLFMPPETAKLDLKVEQFSFTRTMYFPELYDIAIFFHDTRKGICGGVGYRTDVFTTDIIERFLSDLRSTAERAVKDPYSHVASAFAPASGSS